MNSALFIILTNYQLMVSDIYAQYLFENYNITSKFVLCGVDESLIDISKYAHVSIQNKHRLNRLWRVWKRLYYAGNLFCFCPLSKLLNKNESTILFVYNDQEPITNKMIRVVKKHCLNCKVVLVDEGLGIYSETIQKKKTFKEKCRYTFTKLLGSTMQYRAIGDNPLIDIAIVGNDEYYKLLNKSKNQVVLRQSKSIIFDRMNKNYGDNFFDLKQQKYDVLYMGQPFVENGIIEEERQYINWLISIMSDKQIVIKPHPHDEKGKYNEFANRFKNVMVLDDGCSRFPVECIIPNLSVNCIIGYNSSAIVNIANYFSSICCILTYKMQESRLVGKYLFLDFVEDDEQSFFSVNDNIFMPIATDELLNIMQTWKNSRKDDSYKGDKRLNEIDSIMGYFD